MKMHRLKIKRRLPGGDLPGGTFYSVFVIIVLACVLCLGAGICFAQGTLQGDEEIALLKTTIARKEGDLSPSLKKLSFFYFDRHDYDGFAAYAQSLLKKGYDKSPLVYTYMARARMEQIDYWKKIKNWEGVYDKAAVLKEEIARDLETAEKLAKGDPELLLGVKYLRWREAASWNADASILFDELVASSRRVQDESGLGTIRDIADALSSLEDKNLSRRLYEVYSEKLTQAVSKEDLKNAADDFLLKGNVYLAKALFEAYLVRLSDTKEAWAKEVVLAADKFAHRGAGAPLDPVYAETLYKKAFDAAGDAAFGSSSQYRRAFNLERMKDFDACIEQYSRLLSAYPDYADRAKVCFRLGVLEAYARRNIPAATAYFKKIIENFSSFPAGREAVASLYQLGLLSQWLKKTDEARMYYEELLSRVVAEGLDPEKEHLVFLAKDRLQEMDEKREMFYALKLFLEGTFVLAGVDALGESVHTLHIDLTGRPAKVAAGEAVRFSVTTSNPQTGCMMPTYAYEWSGEIGSLSNIPNAPEVTARYETPGIKVAQVAVVGPSGLEGAGFEMVQVKEESESQRVKESE